MPLKTKQFGPTQKDIATALNVSRAAVAIALNPKTCHKLLPDTVSMIKAKAQELNYRPRKQARTLRSGRSYTIGVVCVSGVYHAPQERVRHLARAAIRAGYQLISIDMDWFDGNAAAAQNYLLDVAAEGIIFCNLIAEHFQGWKNFIKERSLPTVSMSSMLEDADEAQFDMKSAYRAITQHHIAQGSRHLHLQLSAHSPLPKNFQPSPVMEDRVKGFVEAIRASGGEVIAEPEAARVFGLPTKFSVHKLTLKGWVQYPPHTELYKNAFDIGYHEGQRILQGGDVDSFVCSNDDIAMGVMAVCAERGLRVPDDIRISGSDNAPFSLYCHPPLTTIEQPPQEMAQWSIRRIVELIEIPKERQSPQRNIFPCKLIFRKSTTLSSPAPANPN